jgi:hypothetical protein
MGENEEEPTSLHFGYSRVQEDERWRRTAQRRDRMGEAVAARLNEGGR